MFECDLCDLSFQTRNRRTTHRKRTHGTLKCRCRRMFVYEKEMEQHRVAMIENAKSYRCPDCCLSFHSEHDRQKHLKRFEHGCPEDIYVEPSTKQTKPKKRRHRKNKTVVGNFACEYCTRRFTKAESLLQHRKSMDHPIKNTETGKSYLDNFYERNVKVDKRDMAASREVVDTKLNMLMMNVRQQPDGTIFNPNVIKAGSVPVNAKIGKADEFDTNVELNVTPTDVRQVGKVDYSYVTDGGMKVKSDICKEGKTIPEGYATVKVEKGSVPDTLLHNGEIIPCKVKEDLSDKIEHAIKDLSLANVDLSSKSHGPALTMTIHSDGKNGVKHDTSVDVTPSIKSDIPITEHGWPRPATRRAVDKGVIDAVIKTGTHLVPKKDVFWSISNSKAERTLLSSIDAGNGCRKKVYKMMKKYVQTCKSQSQDGLPEISSHILKTQVLWSNEKRASKEYWHENNFERCLSDTMKDMESALAKGHLPDYFNPNLNLLEGKSECQLRNLVGHLKAEYKSFQRK